MKLLTNVLPWTPLELRQHLETKVFYDRFIDRYWDLEIKGCSEPFIFSKLFLREGKISAIMLTGEYLLTLGFLRTFKLST